MDSERLFNIVFVMVVIYTLLTAPSLPFVARVLKVARRSEPRGLEVEAAPLERIAADLLQVTISPASHMHGVEVGELRLPVGASVSLVIRDGDILVPERRTVLKHGDDLLVVTPRKLREKTEERLRQVSEGGRLAQWLGPRKRRAADRSSPAGCRCRRRPRRPPTSCRGQLLEVVADDDGDADPDAVPADHLAARQPAGDQPDVGALGTWRSRWPSWDPRVAGALPVSPALKPSSSNRSIVRPASPLRSLAL